MLFCKFLVGVIFSSNIIGAGDFDAWIPVKKVPKVEESFVDVDPSIWVFFLKKMEGERFSVRFPEDPRRFIDERGMVFQACKNGEVFEVIVLASERIASLEEQVLEKIIRTDHHTYHLRVISSHSDSPNAAQFFNSFSVFP